MAHALEAARAALGPQLLAELVGERDALAVGEQELQDLAGAVGQPAAGDRALGPLHGGAPERHDAQPRARGPVRRGAPAAVVRIAGAKLGEDLHGFVRHPGHRHPGRALSGAVREVHPDLRQRPGLLGGALVEAQALQRPARPAAADEPADQRRRPRRRGRPRPRRSARQRR